LKPVATAAMRAAMRVCELVLTAASELYDDIADRTAFDRFMRGNGIRQRESGLRNAVEQHAGLASVVYGFDRMFTLFRVKLVNKEELHAGRIEQAKGGRDVASGPVRRR
jgi:hypothetical protein